jgi:putative ABC transport system permease protein
MLLRLARRYISRRLFQSVLFILGVALGVAMVIAIDLANGSASRAFELSTESVTGKATHQIIGGPSGLPTDLYRQLRLDLGLRDSAPVVEAYVQAVNLNNQLLRLFGVDPFAEPPFRTYLSEVRVAGAVSNNEESNQAAFSAVNAFIAEPGSALISQTMAERYDVATGDALSLRIGDRWEQVRVVGVIQAANEASAQAIDDLLLTDIATAQEILRTPGAITRIDLILPPDYDLAQIEAILPPGATLITPETGRGALDQMTAAFELNLQALSLLALVVGAFLIYNTVTFSVVQRRPIIGILRALGATRSQIFTLMLGEAILLGLIGTALGMALGIIFGRAAVGLVSRTISDLYFAVNVQRVAVPPETLLKGAAIGLFVSLLAALIPSYEATRTPPAGTLRRSDVEQSALRLVPLITIAAIALNIIGAGLLRVPTQDIVISFAALFAIVVGGAFLAPLALVAFMRLSTPLTDRLFGVLGRMAPRAVVRSLSRTSVAVAALTVAISVIVGVSVMIGSFRDTVSDWLETTLGADIYVSPPTVIVNDPATIAPEIVDILRAEPGVADVATVRSINVLAPDYPDLPPVNIAAVSADITSRPRRFAWNIAPNGDYWTALQNGAVAVTEPFAYRRGITPENNQITLMTDRGEHTFSVVGVYYDYSTDQGRVLMFDNVYHQYWDDRQISSAAVYLEPGADLEATIEHLEAETLADYDVVIQDYRTLRDWVFHVFERAFTITTALQVLATVVAFIGILSALMSLQLEHTREYGVMRAVGMTPRQLWNFTLIQTGLMGTTAGLLALPIGFVLALVLIYVINVRSFGWTMFLTLSPNEFIQAFAVAVIAALVAGMYPAWRLSKLATARALRNE